MSSNNQHQSGEKKQHLKFLENSLFENPVRPIAIVVGGDRVASKLNIVLNLVDKVDKILVGGLAVYTFRKALGHWVGDNLVAEEMLDTAKNIINTAAEQNVDLLLAPDSVIVPTDMLRQRVEEEKVKLQHPDLRQSVFLASTSAQKSTKAGAEAKKGTKIDLHTASPTGLGRTTKNHDEQLFQEESAEESALKAQEEVSEATNAAREAARMCGSGEIPVGWTGVDVGECTVPAFCKKLKGANTILWIGPIGMCEIEDYAQGTMDLINYLAHLDASGTTTIVCGGHTSALLDRTDYSKTFSQVYRVLDTELLQLLERQHNGGLPQGRNGGVKDAAPNVASTLLYKSDLMA